jgi:hypothetical protein
MTDLEVERRKVARGEATVPVDAPLPSVFICRRNTALQQ